MAFSTWVEVVPHRWTAWEGRWLGHGRGPGHGVTVLQKPRHYGIVWLGRTSELIHSLQCHGRDTSHHPRAAPSPVPCVRPGFGHSRGQPQLLSPIPFIPLAPPAAICAWEQLRDRGQSCPQGPEPVPVPLGHLLPCCRCPRGWLALPPPCPGLFLCEQRQSLRRNAKPGEVWISEPKLRPGAKLWGEFWQSFRRVRAEFQASRA